ncbi:MAG: adenylyl-sulfate kinase [Thermoleophilia bacterium]|nr:adenylyl-sulfate kinase [Thermoleophilia bacterium]
MADHYKGVTLWFTGLSQSGKTTTAQLVGQRLRERGVDRLENLDGDLMRMGLSKGLGFSKADRDENIRRFYLVAQLLTRNDVVTIVAAISPYREARDTARAVIGDFAEIYVKAPLQVCADRDTKGLYAKAMSGELKEFTGVSDPYEEPLNAELVLDTEHSTPEDNANRVLAWMEEHGYLQPLAAGVADTVSA